MLTLTIFDELSGSIINVVVEDQSKTIRSVKQSIMQQTGIPIERQQLSYNGQVLGDGDTLLSKGIKNDDLLTYNTIQPQQQQQQRQQQQQNPLQSLDLSETPTPVILQAFRSNQELMRQISASNPDFAQAILTDNVQLADQFLAPLRERQRKAKILARLEVDPFDAEAQRILEEIIQQENIEENMHTAMEYNPAAFASVYMLYIHAEVNNVPLKAFVDSGAQMTIMSKECATRCDLMRLCDKRFKGVAKGVGTANIIGRIHMAQLKIGNSFFPTTITVLDQEGMEFLIGLDMLKQWQACIDLKQNALIIDNEKAEFLSEKDLPNRERQEQDKALSSDPLSPVTKPGPQQQPSRTTATTPQKSVEQQQLEALKQFFGASQNQTTSPAANNEQSIKQLMEMGFDRISVVEALRESNGDVESATNILLRNKFGI